MSARRKGLFFVLLIFALFVVAEISARVLVRYPLPPFGEGKERRDWLAMKERELAGREPPKAGTFDPVLGWRTNPGYASPDGKVHVNAQGLRATREYAEIPPPGVRRIFAAGESFVFGEEVADDETWCAQLEALVPGSEVLNYGVGGYGTDQALLRLTREAKGPAEAVLVGVMVENIGRNVNRFRPLWQPQSPPVGKPRYLARPEGLELVPLPFSSTAELVAAVRAERAPRALAAHEYWSDPYVPSWLTWSTLARAIGAREAYADRDLATLWGDTSGEPFLTTLALLEAFRGPARAAGNARLIVVIFPRRGNVSALLDGAKPYWRPLTDALDARGIEWIDTSEPLLAAARSGTKEHELYVMAHFSPLGNEIVAQAVAARLAQSPPQPRR
jgi:hypothetical protein